jgi:hypothetical protein
MRSITILATTLIVTIVTSFTLTAQLTVSSKSFSNNGMIPGKYSCEWEEVNPPLQFTGVPKGTKALALIVHDPDAPRSGGFTHWVVWNLDPTRGIPENFRGASQGLNDAKTMGYKGMCPPSGTHHYHFKVYALNAILNLGQNTDKTGLEKAMVGHILAQNELVGLYKKTKE